MLVYFEEKENGECLTDCPYTVNCKVNSLLCSTCQCYFGIVDGKVKCSGDRVFKRGEK